MITNQRQYGISKKELRKFEGALEAGQGSPPSEGVHPRIHQAMLEGLESQIEDLREQIERYEALKDGKVRGRSLRTLGDLPEALIEGRIAAGITQRELGERVGLAEQQVQRYEVSRYAGVSIDRVGEVVAALGLKLSEVTYEPSKRRRVRRSGGAAAKRSGGSGSKGTTRPTSQGLSSAKSKKSVTSSARSSSRSASKSRRSKA